MKDRPPVRITLTDIASALPDPACPSVRRLVMTVLLECFIATMERESGIVTA